MRHFTASGLWFLGDDPTRRVAGTLHYSDRGILLKLLGDFRGGWTPRSEPYSLIHGVVSKNPYGEFVTLNDCFTTRTKLSSAGIGLETIYCNRGIVGDTHLRPDHDGFDALDITISYLSDWFRRTGVESRTVPGERFGLDVSYRQPESVRFSIGDEILILGMEAVSSESLRKLSIKEEAHLLIKPLPPLTPEQFHVAYIRPLQDLLSFATDTANAVEEIELREGRAVDRKPERDRKYQLIYKPIFRLKRKKDHLAPDDMLFTFDDAREAGLNIFEKWIEFTKRHEAFCTVYFASLYAPPRYLDEKFLRLMSAFTLLTTSLGEVSKRTALFLEDVKMLSTQRFTDEERALLVHSMPTGPEIEMPFHLLRHLEEHRHLVSQIIGDDLSGFVRSVANTLAFAERRKALDNAPPIQRDELHYTMHKLSMLIKIIVLGELGFNEDQLTKLVERNKNFVQLRSL
jgi:hypothetical protein